MWFEDVLFFIAAIGALAARSGVVILQNPFYSVLSLVCHLLGLAVLFLLLNAEFIAAAQVVVYAGAVMVLYLFVVAYIGGADEPLRPESGGIALFGPVFAFCVAVELCIAFIASGLKALNTDGPDVGAGIRLARCHRRAAPHELSDPVRGRVLPAARGGPSARWCSLGGGGAWRARAWRTTWYLILSAFIFAIGVAGVISRRNPLVVLLCLELMLNAGNLALVAFSRMHGGEAGQVFALIVMVIAACEVVIGLGIIVAMYRNRLPIDIDEMSELRG
jgi:NADH-quinone oxidoreductase subunit K